MIARVQARLLDDPFYMEEDDVDEVIAHYTESHGDGPLRQSYTVKLSPKKSEEGVPPEPTPMPVSVSVVATPQAPGGPVDDASPAKPDHKPEPEPEPEEPFAATGLGDMPSDRSASRAGRAVTNPEPSCVSGDGWRRRAVSGASYTQRELQHVWYWGADSGMRDQHGKKVREWRAYSESLSYELEDAVERGDYLFPIDVGNGRIVDLKEWPTRGQAWQLTSDLQHKRPVKRETSSVAKMYEEARGALDGGMQRASIAFTEGGVAGAEAIRETRVIAQQTHESIRAQQEAGKSKLGKALNSWPALFEKARDRCAAATDPVAASSELLQYVRKFMNDCIEMADPIDRISLSGGGPVESGADQDVIEAVLQSIVLAPYYEGYMGRVREAHLDEELQLTNLRRRLVGRPQVDFLVPPSHVDPDNWTRSCELLAEMNTHHTALGQLGCIVQAAKAVYETVDTFETEPGKTLTVGADEFTPIFIYIVLMSEAVGIYSCIEFIEKCAPESKVFSGEGAYYFMQLTSAAQLLRQLAVADLPPAGQLPIGYGGSDDPDAGLRRLLSSQTSPGDIQWVWSWADDSNRDLGRIQDKFVPYDERKIEELERALAAGARFCQIDPLRHVDLSTSPMWQVVSATEHTGNVLRRRVIRETAAQTMQRRAKYQAHVAARAKRDEAERWRHQAEKLLHADERIPEGTCLWMWPVHGVEGPVGDASYVSFTRKTAGSNRHTVQFARSDSTRVRPGDLPHASSKLYSFQLKDYDVRVLAPISLGDHRPVGVQDGRCSSIYGGTATGVGFGRGGFYSPSCWRPETNKEGEW